MWSYAYTWYYFIPTGPIQHWARALCSYITLYYNYNRTRSFYNIYRRLPPGPSRTLAYDNLLRHKYIKPIRFFLVPQSSLPFRHTPSRARVFLATAVIITIIIKRQRRRRRRPIHLARPSLYTHCTMRYETIMWARKTKILRRRFKKEKKAYLIFFFSIY